jgi:hypothetical protein
MDGQFPERVLLANLAPLVHELIHWSLILKAQTSGVIEHSYMICTEDPTACGPPTFRPLRRDRSVVQIWELYMGNDVVNRWSGTEIPIDAASWKWPEKFQLQSFPSQNASFDKQLTGKSLQDKNG